MLPEQVWDAPDIPGCGLALGRPSGSAMPLVWAHAEHVKLLRSLRDGQVFDTPHQAARRYAVGKRASPIAIWQPAQRRREVEAGKSLRIQTPGPGVVRWRIDGHVRSQELATRPTGLGVQAADIPSAGLKPGTRITFVVSADGLPDAASEDNCVEVT